jgi:hypothetical protein
MFALRQPRWHPFQQELTKACRFLSDNSFLFQFLSFLSHVSFFSCATHFSLRLATMASYPYPHHDTIVLQHTPTMQSWWDPPTGSPYQADTDTAFL